MSATERVRLTALARGRVQGVGYRDFAARQARTLDVAGHVRNLPDGQTVEVVAEGARDVLDALVESLRRGPRSAHVERVDVIWSAARGDADSFEIAY